MTVPGSAPADRPAPWWRRAMGAVRRGWARTSLRLRLVVALVVLVAIGLVITGTVGANLLQRYLVDQVDQRVLEAASHPPRELGGGNLDFASSIVYRLFGPTGSTARVIGAPLGRQSAPALKSLTVKEVENHKGQPFTITGPGGSQWRVVEKVLVSGNPPTAVGTFAAMASLSDVTHTLNRLVLIELLVGIAVLAVLAGVGVILVRLSLRPLTDIEQTAEAIGAGDLSRRVPSADPRTEVGRLSVSLNAMLSQIEAAVRDREWSEREARVSEERMRQFVADAGHELRTPLTSIRGFAELHRQRGERPEAPAAPAESARMMGRIESEATRMSGLVDDLLLLAQLDQRRPLDQQPVDLVPLVADAAFDAHTLAPDRTVKLDLPTASADGDRPAAEGHDRDDEGDDRDDNEAPPVVVFGDEGRLRQILANLVGNALTHTPDGTPVRIGLRTAPVDGHDWAVLEVADQGPGLTTEQASRVFERFYRADPGRSRARGGAGLGLSIVAALAQAHGGRVDVDSQPGTGATFRVWLPVARPV